MKHKIAGVQMSCLPDAEENIRKALRLAGVAAESGAEVIVFQPHPNRRWFPREADQSALDLAEPADGPTLARFREEAGRLGRCFVVPLYEREGDRRYYTAFVIGPDGNLRGHYRKSHLPDIPLWRERFYFSPGDTGYPVFEHAGLRFGIQLCWDNFFPEGARALALGGASVILSPTAAAFASARKWETVLAASAVVNGVYLMRVNRVGRETGLDFYGRSFCVDPEGEFLIGPIGLNDGVILADVDTDRLDDVRRQWGFLADRRPATYGALGDPPGEEVSGG
jgi:predicted amidohydrolase